MTLAELILKRDAVLADQADVKAKMAQLDANLSDVDAEIDLVITGPVRQSRQLSGKDTGTVDVLVQGVMVSHTIPKKVQWDQEELGRIRLLIRQHNDDPDLYMDAKTTYKIGEKAYASMHPAIREVLDQARTVKPGTPVVKFDLRAG